MDRNVFCCVALVFRMAQYYILFGIAVVTLWVTPTTLLVPCQVRFLKAGDFCAGASFVACSSSVFL